MIRNFDQALSLCARPSWYQLPNKEYWNYVDKTFIDDENKQKNVKLLLVSLDDKSMFPKKLNRFVQKHHFKTNLLWLNETDVKEYKNCVCKDRCNCDLPLITVIRDPQNVYIQVMLLLS